MFTGIITHIGQIERIEKKGDWRITIAAPEVVRGLAVGASVSVSGVCLTVIRKTANSFTVQVSKETLSLTTLGGWKKGTRVNLERALKVGDELGGHFVSGHVDGVVTLDKIEKVGGSKVMWFSLTRGGKAAASLSQWERGRVRASMSLNRLIAPKGSVTLDGVSLTVNQVAGKGFSVNIIPHTLIATTLAERKAGDAVNLEIDLIARTLMRLRGK